MRIGDGAGGVARLSTGTPLLERRWYLVTASFDAASGRLELSQEPVSHKTFQPDDARTVRRPPRSAPPAAACPSCSRPGTRGRRMRPAADRPTARPAAISTASSTARASPPRARPGRDGGARRATALPDELVTSVLVARWDFSLDIPSETILDISPNRMHGRTVNLPARAMTGHNWTGEVMDWTQAPEQYGAIHFHDDDLVDAGWQEDFRFEVPQDLRSGVYAARLGANEAEF